MLLQLKNRTSEYRNFRIAELALVIALAIILSGCGFRPVYELKTGERSLSEISVRPVDFGRAGQILTTELEDLFNPGRKASAPKYTLFLALDRKKEGLAIQQDKEVTRYNLIVKADYRLEEIGAGKVITSGSSRVFGSFDAVESDFGTYAAEEDTLNRIMKELAKNIEMKLQAALPKK